MEHSFNVDLYVYDISQGMARQFAPMLIKRQLDGIWHSGIVVYNTEYFFGGGICSAPKGQTPFGVPTRIEHLGTTEIP